MIKSAFTNSTTPTCLEPNYILRTCELTSLKWDDDDASFHTLSLQMSVCWLWRQKPTKAASPYVRMRMRSVCLHALWKVCGNKLVLCVQMLYWFTQSDSSQTPRTMAAVWYKLLKIYFRALMDHFFFFFFSLSHSLGDRWGTTMWWVLGNVAWWSPSLSMPVIVAHKKWKYTSQLGATIHLRGCEILLTLLNYSVELW